MSTMLLVAHTGLFHFNPLSLFNGPPLSCLDHFHCAPSETALAYTRPTRGEAEEPYYENLPEGPIRQKKLYNNFGSMQDFMI